MNHRPENFSDRFAKFLTMALRFIADSFFAKKYGHRAVVLETVAAVPGMVGGMWKHLTCLRKLTDDRGQIKILLEEADNERMHLMTFLEIASPTWFERIIILTAQAIFWNIYFVLYVLSPRTAHRLVGYFEEEAVISYTAYLQQVDADPTLNVAAPQLAIDYWKLPANAKLRDVIIAVRNDEINHSQVNHVFADELNSDKSKASIKSQAQHPSR
jgi:ubiquinol oxidase